MVARAFGSEGAIAVVANTAIWNLLASSAEGVVLWALTEKVEISSNIRGRVDALTAIAVVRLADVVHSKVVVDIRSSTRSNGPQSGLAHPNWSLHVERVFDFSVVAKHTTKFDAAVGSKSESLEDKCGPVPVARRTMSWLAKLSRTFHAIDDDWGDRGISSSNGARRSARRLWGTCIFTDRREKRKQDGFIVRLRDISIVIGVDDNRFWLWDSKNVSNRVLTDEGRRRRRIQNRRSRTNNTSVDRWHKTSKFRVTSIGDPDSLTTWMLGTTADLR
jgi:hypothetical protein